MTGAAAFILHFSFFLGRILSYRDFGLPPEWTSVQSWLVDSAAKPANCSHHGNDWVKKFPNIPCLKSYTSHPEPSYWENWPKRDLPQTPNTKINSELLHALFSDYRFQLNPAVQRWGEKAILYLREGANSHQLSSLPSINCKNSSNLAESGERVSDTIAQGIRKGFIAGPFNSEPLNDFRSNTMTGIRQKDKIRLVMDLSRPEKNSYNENIIPFSSRSVSMSSPKQFSFSLLESGRGAVMSKHDWKDAYKNIPMKIEDLRLQGFSWLDKFFVELSLVFGSVNSVEAFDNLGELIISLACIFSGFPKFLTHRTLDDVPVVSPKESGLTQKFSTVYKKLCSDLGIELAPDCPNNDKAFTNQTNGTVLGFVFDSNLLTWSFSETKTDDLLQRITVFLGRRTSNLLSTQELAGSLEHFGSMAPFTKAFRLPIYLFIRKFKSNNNIQLFIPNSVRSDLAIWANIIDYSRQGVPIHPRPSLPPIHSIYCTSDAAGIDLSMTPSELRGQKFGAASILHSHDQKSVLKVSRVFWTDHLLFYAKDNIGTRLAAKSSTLEAIGVLLPFLSFPASLSGSNVILQVDNMAVVHGWKSKHVAHDIEASIMIRAIHLLSSFLRCRVYIEHIPRLSSPGAVLADHLTRSSSTSDTEEKLASSLMSPVDSPALDNWLQKPVADWSLPQSLLQELVIKKM